MRAKRVLAALCACLLLTGCASLLDREYSVVQEHSRRYWESEAADTLRAESYQDIVNDLLLLVGRHTETALLRLYEFQNDTAVAGALERAASEVQLETPLGAYAVEYITTETQRQRSFYEVSIRISYRRSLEQIQAVVNATSTAALADLLSGALSGGKAELAVRIGYWGADDAQTVTETMAALRVEAGLTEEDDPWAVAFYPAEGKVGLVEFLLDGETVLEALDEGETNLHLVFAPVEEDEEDGEEAGETPEEGAEAAEAAEKSETGKESKPAKQPTAEQPSESEKTAEAERAETADAPPQG